MSTGKDFIRSLSEMKEYPSLEIPDEEIIKIALGGRTAFLRVSSILFPPLVPILLKQPAKKFFITLLLTLLILVPGTIYAWKLVSSMNGKLLKKQIVKLPFRFDLKVNSKYLVNVALNEFNVGKWNQAVNKNNQLRAKNKEMENNYNTLYSYYEGNLARYNLAQQDLIKQVSDPNMNWVQKGMFVGSSSLEKPSKPSKPNYYKIKKLDENDFYEHSGNKEFEDQMNEYSPDENHSMFFTFVNDYETFNSLMSCLAYAEKINKFAESVYSAKYSDRMSLKKLNIKDDISDNSTKMDFDRTIMENVVKSHIEGLARKEASKKFSVPDKIKIGKTVVEYSNFDFILDVTAYIPFLAIDYETRNGTQKQGLIEFVTKESL